ncbi:prepilin peptidase [Streptomyces griseoluteus]|uniref:Prepilin peptidase n=1 Tax=Streptomyces griseoluteus TaxID=29306 RepID=A0A4Z1DNF6_STRGP|nr:A24 family peptidase [Streptomyces griseoluteus]TGN86916.1 prepilin peptidase [Streptomyces griseoluteus]GHF31601.1 prepilin peptidase [Streptomyces griseoluteus]
MTDVLPVALAALWGALTGALLPRAAYRFTTPQGTPWRTTCEADHPLTGWLGATPCRRCPRTTTPALPTVTALVCALLALATGPRPELAAWLTLAPVATLLTAVDLRVHRLPDPLTLPLTPAVLTLLALAAQLPDHTGSYRTALYGALTLAAAYLALHLLNPSGMGFGDVKLAPALGASLGWYGWPTLMLGTCATFTTGALYGLALLLTRRATRKSAIPFGPFLLTGTLLGVLLGAYTS